MARDFDGSADYLEGAFVPVTPYPVWTCAWANTDDGGAEGAIVVVSNDASAVFFRYGLVQVGGSFLYIVNGVDASAEIEAGTATVGTWHHVLGLSRDATDHELYVDGTSVGTSNTDPGALTGLDSTTIGAENTDAGFNTLFNGQIGEVGIGNVSLVVNEIVGLANRTHLSRARGIQAYYPIYGFNSPEPDLTGAKNNLTVTSAPPLANHPPVIPYSARFWGHGPLVEAPVGAAYYQQYLRTVIRAA